MSISKKESARESARAREREREDFNVKLLQAGPIFVDGHVKSQSQPLLSLEAELGFIQ